MKSTDVIEPETKRQKAGSPAVPGSAPRTEAETESLVHDYAREHCAENTGHCNGCQHRKSAALFGRPDEDDWCYLAEGNLRESSVEMCPALSPQSDKHSGPATGRATTTTND